MNEFLTAYGVNTAASCFDLLTTAILHKKTGAPDDFKVVKEFLDKRGSSKGAFEIELGRRATYLAVSLLALGGEQIYGMITHQEVFPFHLLALYGPALIYFGAGLLNLIPIAFNKGDGNDVF